jgi:multiple sugar transport system substrate-binding protein
MDLLSTRLHRRTMVSVGAGAVLATFGMRKESVAAGTPVVRFAYFGTDEEHAAYEQLIATFEAAFPEIAIESIALPSGDATLVPKHEKGNPYQPWLQASFSGDNYPDVLLLNYRNLGEFTSRGLIEPVGDYLAKSTTINEEDFYAESLNAFRFPTLTRYELGGIPQNASSLVVYYNKGVFDELGVTYPTESWTWQEFAETASALTVDRDGDGLIGTYGLAIDPALSRFAAFIWGAGGDFVDDPDWPTQMDFSSNAAQNGLRFLVSLGETGLKVTPSEYKTFEETDLNRFQGGRAAMFIHTRRIVPTLRATPDLRWDVAPLPIGERAANVLHVDGFCMASMSQKKDAAWTFMEFANGPKGQEILAATGRTVPSLRAVAESDAFLKGSSSISDQLGLNTITMPPERARVFVDNVAISRRLPAIANWPGVEWAFNRSFRQAYYSDGDIPAAIARTMTRTEGLLGTPLTTKRNLFFTEASEAEE